MMDDMEEGIAQLGNIMEEAIADELFLQHEVTAEEKVFVLNCLETTKNIWDIGPLVMMYRHMKSQHDLFPNVEK